MISGYIMIEYDIWDIWYVRQKLCTSNRQNPIGPWFLITIFPIIKGIKTVGQTWILDHVGAS